MRRVLVAAAALAVFCLVCSCQSAGATGFGFFAIRRDLARPAEWEKYCLHMKAMGADTMVFIPRSEADCIEQVETALRVGLIHKEIPIVCLMEWGEWDTQATLLAQSRARAPNGKDWPELIMYGTDEPEKVEQVIPWAVPYKAAGFCPTTAVCNPNVAEFAKYLGMIFVVCNPGVHTADRVAAIKAAGCRYSVYNFALKKAPRALARYYTGAWSWQHEPELNMCWSYKDAIEDLPTGPVAKECLVGWSEGVKDYRMLKAIDKARGEKDWYFWPGTGQGGVKPVPSADFWAYVAVTAPEDPVAKALADRMGLATPSVAVAPMILRPGPDAPTVPAIAPAAPIGRPVAVVAPTPAVAPWSAARMNWWRALDAGMQAQLKARGQGPPEGAALGPTDMPDELPPGIGPGVRP
jgi:hypothetical protein